MLRWLSTVLSFRCTSLMASQPEIAIFVMFHICNSVLTSEIRYKPFIVPFYLAKSTVPVIILYFLNIYLDSPFCHSFANLYFFCFTKSEILQMSVPQQKGVQTEGGTLKTKVSFNEAENPNMQETKRQMAKKTNKKKLQKQTGAKNLRNTNQRSTWNRGKNMRNTGLASGKQKAPNRKLTDLQKC